MKFFIISLSVYLSSLFLIGCTAENSNNGFDKEYIQKQYVKNELSQLTDSGEYLAIYPPAGNLEHTFEPSPEFTGILGSGFVSATGEVRSTCILNPTLKINDTADGQSISYFMDHITSSSQLRSLWRLGVSASLNYGVFSGSAKAKFMKEHSLNKFKSTLLLRATVKNQIQTLEEIKLTEDAENLLKGRNGMANFFKACGDSFLVGRITGGQYDAIVEIESKTQRDYEKRENEFSASYKGASGNVEWESTLEEILKDDKVSIRQFILGGTEKIPEKDKIEEFARSLPTLVSNSGKPSVFSYTTRSYCSLPNIQIQQKCPKIDQPAVVLEKISSNLHKAYSVRDEIEFISKNPAHFVADELESTLYELSKNNNQDIKDLLLAANTCVAKANVLNDCETNIKKLSANSSELPLRITAEEIFRGDCKQFGPYFASKPKLTFPPVKRCKGCASAPMGKPRYDGFNNLCQNEFLGYSGTIDHPKKTKKVKVISGGPKECLIGQVVFEDYVPICEVKDFGYLVSTEKEEDIPNLNYIKHPCDPFAEGIVFEGEKPKNHNCRAGSLPGDFIRLENHQRIRLQQE